MPVVFAAVTPHSGNMMRDVSLATHIPKTRMAMQEMHRLFQAARPDAVALITPHGHSVDGAYSLGISPRCAGVQDGVRVEAVTDLSLAASWAAHAAGYGVSVVSLTASPPDAPFPLDWGASIPLHLLAPAPQTPPVVIACPSASLTRTQLIAWGKRW